MTLRALWCLPTYLDEEANAADHVLNQRVGQVADELEEPSFNRAERRLLRLHIASVVERVGFNPDSARETPHEILRRRESSSLDPADAFDRDVCGLGNILLRETGFVPQGPHASPDPGSFLGSGHVPRLGEAPSADQDQQIKSIDLISSTRWRDPRAVMTLKRSCVLGALLSSAALLGCDKKNDSLPAPVVSAQPRPSGSAAPSTSTPPASAPKVVEATSKALAAHPEAMLQVPWQWRDRVAAHLRGETSGEACPEAQKPKNEFDKGSTPCAADNDRAVSFLKGCPQLATFEARLPKYDFSNKRYVITDETAKAQRALALDGRTWLRDYAFVVFPGVAPAYKLDGLGSSPAMCSQGGLADTEAAISGLALPWEVPEGEARVVREKLDKAKSEEGDKAKVMMEVAFVLDGGRTQDALTCGLKPAKAVPTGKVIGWRLYVSTTPRENLSEWMGTMEWEVPSSCADAKTFFGIKDEPAKESACICDLSAKFDPYKWFPVTGAMLDATDNCIPPWESDVDKLKGQLQKSGELFDSFKKRLGDAKECPTDKGAKAKMQAMIADVEKVRAGWTTALGAEKPERPALKTASDAACRLFHRLKDPVKTVGCSK